MQAPFVDDSACTALFLYADRPERGQNVVQLAFDRYLLSWLAGRYLSEVRTEAPSFPCQGLLGAGDTILGDTW